MKKKVFLAAAVALGTMLMAMPVLPATTVGIVTTAAGGISFRTVRTRALPGCRSTIPGTSWMLPVTCRPVG